MNENQESPKSSYFSQEDLRQAEWIYLFWMVTESKEITKKIKCEKCLAAKKAFCIMYQKGIFKNMSKSDYKSFKNKQINKERMYDVSIYLTLKKELPKFVQIDEEKKSTTVDEEMVKELGSRMGVQKKMCMKCARNVLKGMKEMTGEKEEEEEDDEEDELCMGMWPLSPKSPMVHIVNAYLSSNSQSGAPKNDDEDDDDEEDDDDDENDSAEGADTGARRGAGNGESLS